jgi:hypothetical protein
MPSLPPSRDVSNPERQQQLENLQIATALGMGSRPRTKIKPMIVSDRAHSENLYAPEIQRLMNPQPDDPNWANDMYAQLEAKERARQEDQPQSKAGTVRVGGGGDSDMDSATEQMSYGRIGANIQREADHDKDSY